MKRNKFIKSDLVTDINIILNNPNRKFCIIYNNKEKFIDYLSLSNMTFSTVIDLLKNNCIYLTKTIEVEILSNKKNIKKQESDKTKIISTSSTTSNCKTSLKDIYG